MMSSYAVSTKCSVVVAVAALGVVMSGQRAHAQPGTVLSHQKISDTQGGFTGTLDNNDRFGISASSLGDLDGDGGRRCSPSGVLNVLTQECLPFV